MRDNGFTDTDALLAIATDDRTFVFDVPSAITAGTAINLPDLRRHHIQPAVLNANWGIAAIAAANGLDTPVA